MQTLVIERDGGCRLQWKSCQRNLLGHFIVAVCTAICRRYKIYKEKEAIIRGVPAGVEYEVSDSPTLLIGARLMCRSIVGKMTITWKNVITVAKEGTHF